MFKQVSFWVKAQTGMHNGSHDSWERLVEAVLQREQLREIALDHSWSSSSTSSVSTSRYSSSDVDNKVKMARRNGGHQLYSTEPKMKAATTKIRQQIIQATTYFKKFKSQKKEKYAEPETENMFDKIVFLEDRNLAFDLQDLLSASSIKTLGRGAFGPTFAAKLQNGPTMVVKEFLEVSASVLEFEQQMKILGSIKHDNVVIPWGYHFSNYYKFVLYDYYERKSVSAMLHLHEDRYFLDRKTRLCIAIGAARGLAHIHTMCGGNLIHGNVKASNIFLNSHGYGCISDLCFAKLISPAAPPFAWIGGYAAPEVIDTGTVSQASDVYGFGILLLELLTGKSPKNYRGNDKAEDFVEWVRSILGEGWSFEFDGKNFMFTTMEEFVEILKIGMSCVARVPEHRPKMPDVLKMMENVEKPNEDFDYRPLLGWDTRSTDSGDSFLSEGS